MKVIYSIIVCLAALGGKAQEVSTPVGSTARAGDRPRAVPAAGSTTNTVESNPILGGVYLRSDWHAEQKPVPV